MLDWWDEKGPPVYVSVASYLGLVKKRSKPTGTPAKEGHKGDDLNELLKLAGPGGMFH